MHKIIFFGSSDYCFPVLASLQKNFNLLSVVTKTKDNPVGKFATEKNLQIFAPMSSKELAGLKASLKALNPDLFVVADFGFIIPESIFTIPKHQTLNIHFSRLPALRGASPVQYTILFGLENASVSLIKMASDVDTGEIIRIIDYKKINPHLESTKSLYSLLFEKIADDLPEIIRAYLENKIKPLKQVESKATLTRRIEKSDGFIPFTILKTLLDNNSKLKTLIDFPPDSLLLKAILKSESPKVAIGNALRAFTPWPGLWTILPDNKRLKILSVIPPVRLWQKQVEGSSKLKSKKLILGSVQLEGKNAVTWKQFLEGHPDYANLLPASSIATKSSL